MFVIVWLESVENEALTSYQRSLASAANAALRTVQSFDQCPVRFRLERIRPNL